MERHRQPRPRAEARPEGPLRYGVLDLETQRLAEEVGGWKNGHLMRVSEAVLYNQASDRYETHKERATYPSSSPACASWSWWRASTSSASTTPC